MKKLLNNLNQNSENDEILELKNQIELFRSYNKFSPEEKLVKIKFQAMNQEIDQDYSIIAKNTDPFTKIENMLYEQYPSYKESKEENCFLGNGVKIQKNLTIKENEIKDDDILILNNIQI